MSGIYHEWNGTVLTVTSDSGTSSADLKGEMGVRGAQGVAGANIGVDAVPPASVEDAGKFLRISADGKWVIEGVTNAEEVAY